MSQLMVWCMTEGGVVHGKTIRAKDWEAHEKNGYVKNPLHLPDSVDRISAAVVEGKKHELERAKDIKSKLEKVEDTEDENYSTICDSVEHLETEIAEREAAPYATERELGQFGAMVDDLVEVENFLLNLGSEKSKNKVKRFLISRGVEFDVSAGLKELKRVAREAFNVD